MALPRHRRSPRGAARFFGGPGPSAANGPAAEGEGARSLRLRPEAKLEEALALAGRRQRTPSVESEVPVTATEIAALSATAPEIPPFGHWERGGFISSREEQ